MGHGYPGCGVACQVAFPGLYPDLILAFKAMKAAGLTEDQAVQLAGDAGQLAGWLYANNFSPLAGIAAALVASQCTLCAVDSAY